LVTYFADSMDLGWSLTSGGGDPRAPDAERIYENRETWAICLTQAWALRGDFGKVALCRRGRKAAERSSLGYHWRRRSMRFSSRAGLSGRKEEAVREGERASRSSRNQGCIRRRVPPAPARRAFTSSSASGKGARPTGALLKIPISFRLAGSGSTPTSTRCEKTRGSEACGGTVSWTSPTGSNPCGIPVPIGGITGLESACGRSEKTASANVGPIEPIGSVPLAAWVDDLPNSTSVWPKVS